MIKPGKYRHFKGGEYELIGIAKHSETLEPMVVYRALYGEGGLWVRPAAMFCTGCAIRSVQAQPVWGRISCLSPLVRSFIRCIRFAAFLWP